MKVSCYKTLSVIIPVYNEEKSISRVVEEVFRADSLGLSKEVIVINDGSTDLTPIKLFRLKKVYSSLKLISWAKNRGKGYSVKEGFLESTGELVLVQDADGEYSPHDYPLLLRPFFDAEADVVYGSRLMTTQAHRVLFFWHYKINQFLSCFSNLLNNLNLTDVETGFKVFKGDIIRQIAPALISKRFGFELEITARLAKIKNLKIYEVGISYFGRTYQEGKKIGWQDGLLAVWEIIKFSLLRK